MYSLLLFSILRIEENCTTADIVANIFNDIFNGICSTACGQECKQSPSVIGPLCLYDSPPTVMDIRCQRTKNMKIKKKEENKVFEAKEIFTLAYCVFKQMAASPISGRDLFLFHTEICTRSSTIGVVGFMCTVRFFFSFFLSSFCCYYCYCCCRWR